MRFAQAVVVLGILVCASGAFLLFGPVALLVAGVLLAAYGLIGVEVDR